MKYFILIILLINCIKSSSQDFIITSSRKDSIIESQIGKQYSLFSLQPTENKNIKNKDILGKITVINFWFKDCAPCIAEFESLNNLFNKFSSNPKFQFISITFESPETIEKIKKKYNIPYTIYSIPQEECSSLNYGLGYPVTIILDKNSNITDLNSGGFIDKEKVELQFKTVEQKILDLLEN